MPRRYRIETEGDMSETELNDARHFINRVLTDPKGWNMYDVRFVDMTDTKDTNPDIIKVYFVSNDTMRKIYPSLDGLSAYDLESNVIYFNISNWDNGGKDPFPPNEDGDDALTRYRTYVINHEFGHSIGLDHVRPKNRKGLPGSIMMQMTKGLNHIAPCTLNEWPLDPDEDNFDEFKDGKRLDLVVPKLSGGGVYPQTGGMQCLCLFMLLFVFIGLVVLLIRYIHRCNIDKFNDGRYLPITRQRSRNCLYP